MDKINIYVPQNIGTILDNDAVQFEVLKKDGYTVNKNKFLSMLIQGYYDDYIIEARTKHNAICSILSENGINGEQQEKIAEEILKKVILPEVPSRKGKNPVKLSLKPTKDTIPLIQYIMDDIGADDYISQFFCRMLMSYCEKPFSTREQILFKSKYDFILSACESQASIRFTTIWNLVDVHEVIPYKIVVGTEEMYNYLLCGERNKKSGKMEAMSYRLNRIDALRWGTTRETLTEEVVTYLERMIQYGPQFAINDDEETCVKLTEEGRKFFNRIYYGRPKVEQMEHVDGAWLYYFRCSKEQLYQYFKRFENGRVEVIMPEKLRIRIMEFHSQELKLYKKGRKEQ